MGVTYGFMNMKGNMGSQNVSTYFAGSDAVGAMLPLDAFGQAVAGASKEVTAKHDISELEIIAGPATGSLQVLVDGAPCGVAVDLAACQASNNGRPKFPVRIWKGSKVQIRVIAACAA